MDPRDVDRVNAALMDITDGAKASLKVDLPPIKVANSPTVAVHGQIFLVDPSGICTLYRSFKAPFIGRL